MVVGVDVWTLSDALEAPCVDLSTEALAFGHLGRNIISNGMKRKTKKIRDRTKMRKRPIDMDLNMKHPLHVVHMMTCI